MQQTLTYWYNPKYRTIKQIGVKNNVKNFKRRKLEIAERFNLSQAPWLLFPESEKLLRKINYRPVMDQLASAFFDHFTL